MPNASLEVNNKHNLEQSKFSNCSIYCTFFGIFSSISLSADFLHFGHVFGKDRGEHAQKTPKPGESKNRFSLAVQIFNQSLHDCQLELNRYAEKSRPVHKQSI
jgi:N12 class adenine-specific DNA methylase